MTSMRSLKAKDVSLEQERLLSAVAEHLKQPLLYIRQSSELAQKGQPMIPERIRSSANSGLLLVEHFLTWQRYAHNKDLITQSQTSLTALMHKVTEDLKSIASLNQLILNLKINGRYGPVVTDPRLLSSAVSALGLAFIEASQGKSEASEIIFGVHKTRWGITAGVYSADLVLRSNTFERHKELVGAARQLLPLTSHSPMSGVAIADALFRQLSVSLRPSRHKNMDGLAVTLVPSPQLALL